MNSIATRPLAGSFDNQHTLQQQQPPVAHVCLNVVFVVAVVVVVVSSPSILGSVDVTLVWSPWTWWRLIMRWLR